jgi:hypothetical protein
MRASPAQRRQADRGAGGKGSTGVPDVRPVHALPRGAPVPRPEARRRTASRAEGRCRPRDAAVPGGPSGLPEGRSRHPGRSSLCIAVVRQRLTLRVWLNKGAEGSYGDSPTRPASSGCAFSRARPVASKSSPTRGPVVTRESMCARLSVHRCSQLALFKRPTVLPSATTGPRERVQAGANAACFWSVKSLQGSENSEAAASKRERGGRLDKLGVTGSTPVPPI